MKKYFIIENDQHSGTFSIDELKAKNITKDSPIWYEGLDDWTTAGLVEELKPLFPSVPPPFVPKQQTPPPPPVQPESKPTIIIQQPAKKSNSGLVWLFAGIFVVVVIIVLFNISKNGSGSTYNYDNPFEELSIEDQERADPTKYLEATGTYTKAFLNDDYKIEGIILNRATVVSYKNVQVEIRYYDGSKNLIATKHYNLDDQVYPPNMDRSFKLRVEGERGSESIGWDVNYAVAN